MNQTKTQIKTIAIEGSDGAGKQDTTDLLKKFLQEEFHKKVEDFSFPRYYDNTLGGKLCWEALKSERAKNYDFIHRGPEEASLIYLADRVESKPVIKQAIAENDYVIFDRYVESNFIHQGGKIKDVAKRWKLIFLLNLLEYQIFELPRPDMTIFLYLPTELAMERLAKKKEHDIGEDDYDYLENSNQCGLWCANEFGWEIINCYDEENSHEKTRGEILNEVLEKIIV